MNTEPTTIAARLVIIRERIAAAGRAHHRPSDAITLLAVSKGQPAAAIRDAYAAGQGSFGESYLQEAMPKMDTLSDLAIEWHFIGRIQSNKTRQIATHFAWVHGVDRLKIAQRLSEQRPDDRPPLNVCLQVKLSDEPAKGGVDAADLPALARAVAALPRLRLRGLAAIPEATTDADRQRHAFRQLRQAGDRLAAGGIAVDTFSMGMSTDFETAIAEGATIVRIGTAIFGPRR